MTVSNIKISNRNCRIKDEGQIIEVQKKKRRKKKRACTMRKRRSYSSRGRCNWGSTTMTDIKKANHDNKAATLPLQANAPAPQALADPLHGPHNDNNQNQNSNNPPTQPQNPQHGLIPQTPQSSGQPEAETKVGAPGSAGGTALCRHLDPRSSICHVFDEHALLLWSCRRACSGDDDYNVESI